MTDKVTKLWLLHLKHILKEGQIHEGTTEVLNKTFHFDTSWPTIHCENRRINYRFMAGEALYILKGSNDINFLAAILPKFAEYSDDGEFQAGAYGPKVIDQLPYVIECLDRDHNSRQAVLTIWRESPRQSLDIPCTLSMQFLIRGGYLHTVVNMRSSDAFTGLVYDSFCFACISAVVAGHVEVKLGRTYINAGSSHIYERDWDKAAQLINDPGRIEHSHVVSPSLRPDMVRDLTTVASDLKSAKRWLTYAKA